MRSYQTIKSQISKAKLQINLSAFGGAIFNYQNLPEIYKASARKPRSSEYAAVTQN